MEGKLKFHPICDSVTCSVVSSVQSCYSQDNSLFCYCHVISLWHGELCLLYVNVYLKLLVHPKISILLWFSHPCVVSSLYDYFLKTVSAIFEYQ